MLGAAAWPNENGAGAAPPPGAPAPNEANDGAAAAGVPNAKVEVVPDVEPNDEKDVVGPLPAAGGVPKPPNAGEGAAPNAENVVDGAVAGAVAAPAGL